MNGKSLFSELRRRRVLRTATVYLVTGWAVVEAAATILPLLGYPESAAVWIVYLAIAGFPVVLVVAWLFDLTPRGLVRTPDAEAAAPAPAPARTARGRAAGFFGLGMLVALVSFAAYSRFGPHTPRPDASLIESIAVLPFTDLSESGDQQYFSDGMTEELLNRLTHVDGLSVKARSSSFAFRDQKEDVAEIGRRLGVDAVLDGSVRREGGQLRVSARLIDARTGFQVWSESYDREVSSVFAIQDEIATTIVEQLEKQFNPLATAATEWRTTVRAHDRYLLGLQRWHMRTMPAVLEAIRHFEAVVEEDAEYAPAWAGIAQAYAVLPTLGDYPVGDAVARSSAAAAQALALDAQLAEAHGAIGQVAQNFEWDLRSAERAYRRAVTFNEDYATGHQWYAEALMMLGRYDEARAEVKTALELDPLSPAAMSVQGYLLMVAGDTTNALTTYTNLTTLHPDYELGQMNLGLLALHMGRYDEAQAAARAGTPDAQLGTTLASIVAGIADPARRAAAIDAARSLDGQLPATIAALWWSALGEREEALTRIETAVNRREDANLPYVLLHPLLRTLHDDPRFRAAVDSVGVTVR